MSESRPPAGSGQSASDHRRLVVAPLAVLVATLLVVWTASVYVLRNIEGLDPSLRQLVPFVLWSGTILIWVRWQRIRDPLRYLGLGRPAGRALALSFAAFAIVIAWHLIRVSLARQPGGILGELPWYIYVWLLVGVFLNEALLRGLVQQRLTEAFDPAVAIAVTAILGVAFRIPAFFTTTVPMPIDPLVLFGVLIFGLIAGLLRHFPRSLWPALGLQWANSLGQLL